MMMSIKLCSRRHLMRMSGFGLGGIAASMLLRDDGLLADDSTALSKPILEPQTFDLLPKAPPSPARAKAMISMFMIGGPSQIDMYGVNEDVTRDYGTRCLIARRLVERGVRFVQIFNNGQSWDHHESILNLLPKRCTEIDKPAAALVKDLKQRGMLDSTLVHWGGEMGRLPVIQIPSGENPLSRVGRDHNTFGFSMWVAGGGMRGGYVHGVTDDFSHHAVEGIVTHHDWLATVLHLFGLENGNIKFQNGTRELSLVESQSARIVKEILA